MDDGPPNDTTGATGNATADTNFSLPPHHSLASTIQALREYDRINRPLEFSDRFPLLNDFSDSLGFSFLTTVAGSAVLAFSPQYVSEARSWLSAARDSGLALDAYFLQNGRQVESEAFRLQHSTLSTVTDVLAFLQAECWTHVVPRYLAGDISDMTAGGILLVSFAAHVGAAIGSSLTGERILEEVDRAIRRRQAAEEAAEAEQRQQEAAQPE